MSFLAAVKTVKKIEHASLMVINKMGDLPVRHSLSWIMAAAAFKG